MSSRVGSDPRFLLRRDCSGDPFFPLRAPASLMALLVRMVMGVEGVELERPVTCLVLPAETGTTASSLSSVDRKGIVRAVGESGTLALAADGEGFRTAETREEGERAATCAETMLCLAAGSVAALTLCRASWAWGACEQGMALL